MIHYFTACTAAELAPTRAWLEEDGHQIVGTHQAGAEVWLQKTDPSPSFCCDKADPNGVVVIHSRK